MCKNRIDTAEFVKRSKAKHGDRYDYGCSEFIGSTKKVLVSCEKHGQFSITAHKHYNAGQGCAKCSGQSTDIETFAKDMEDVHFGAYEYISLGRELSKSGKKISTVTMKCKHHGEFTQSRSHHRNGTGCPACFGTPNKGTDTFIADARAIHGDTYDYSKVAYKSNSEPVIIVCPIHGDIPMTYASHVSRGCGCKECSTKYTGETIVYLVTISVSGEHFVKVGYTNTDVENRFVRDKDVEVTSIVATLSFATLHEARTIENHIQNKHSKHKFTPKVKFSGHTECFNIEALETIKQDFGV